MQTSGIERVLNWAATPSQIEGTIGRDKEAVIPKASGMTNIQVLGKLIAMNAMRPKVERWGVFSGPFGLAAPEAFLLMEMAPYLQGLADGAGLAPESVGNLLEPILLDYANRWDAEARAAAEAPASAEGDPAAFVEGGGLVGEEAAAS